MSFPTGEEAQSSQSLDCLPQCRQLTFSEIQVATKNFDDLLVIGHGGFGKVYRGTITNGESLLEAAIKRLESTSDQGAEEFWAEVETLSKLRHRNLVSLIGYCNDGNEKILVYEYMPNGTLSDRLHKRRYPLTWIRRLKISLGAARGLEYLHAGTGTGTRQGIVHRDVKSTNILLDDRLESKVSDFGLSKIVPTNQTCTYVSTLVKGTFGYLDPNYFQTNRLTRKSDVYAFGVILFELLCGRKALDASLEDRNLATWAQDSIKEGRLKQIVGSHLRGTISFKRVKEFAQLANRCVNSDPKKRPTMAEVVAGLESILASHEKTYKTLGRKIFGIKVPAALGFSSSHVVGTSLKSMESYLYSVGGENQMFCRFYFTIGVAREYFSRSDMEFGPIVQKGQTKNGQDVIIVGPYPPNEYELCMNQVCIHVKVKHQNLANLLGWCIEATCVYLVYDNPRNYATLEDVLSDHKRTPLNWDKRYRILLGVAGALVYLHKHAPVRVLNCDIRAGSILIDECLDPKLYAFYFAVSAAINKSDCIKIYFEHFWKSGDCFAPEYAMSAHVSTKSDVFNFGCLVLETIAGKVFQNLGAYIDNIWESWVDGTYSNIIDIRLSVDSRSITRFIHIGLWCIQESALDRPTMEEVVAMFLGNSSSQLPNLKDLWNRWSKVDSIDDCACADLDFNRLSDVEIDSQ